MTQGVQDLIKAIDSGDSQAIDAAFQAEMANRISTRLEDLRVSVAKGMFATEQKNGPGDFEEIPDQEFPAEETTDLVNEELEHLEEATYEIDVAHGDSSTKGEPLDNVKKHAAKYNLKVKHISSNGPAGGAHVVHLKGKKEDAHKFISKHYDDSADHDDIEDMYRVHKSVKEETEQIDETSPELKVNYIKRAIGFTGDSGHKYPHRKNLNYAAQSYGIDRGDEDEPGDDDSPAGQTIDKRQYGIARAARLLAKQTKAKK